MEQRVQETIGPSLLFIYFLEWDSVGCLVYISRWLKRNSVAPRCKHQVSLWKAHSSLHYSCSYSPGWSGLYCSSLLVAVAYIPPNMEDFKWSRDQKSQIFIETHHAPFTPKHRYWPGLLFIVHAILYLVATINVSNDPQLVLSTIVFTVSGIHLIAFVDIKMYRKLFASILETFFCLNILSFAIFTWYSLNSTNINQKAVAYTSVITTFIVLLLIIFYRVYTYTTIFSKVRKTSPLRMIKNIFSKLTRNRLLALLTLMTT